MGFFDGLDAALDRGEETRTVPWPLRGSLGRLHRCRGLSQRGSMSLHSWFREIIDPSSVPSSAV